MANNFGFFKEHQPKVIKLPRHAKVVLHPEEEVLASYHQTFFVLHKPITLTLAAIIIPIIPLVRYGLFNQYRGLVVLWSIVFIGYFLKEFLIWHLNTYVITSQRLMKISHEGLFKRLVMETPLDRILNVSYKTTGIASSLIGYGDVEVQVVGLVEPINLKSINEPSEIKDYLWKAHIDSAKNSSQFTEQKISHIQEQQGYTKHNQRIL